jgi:hypothetical protein
VRIYLAARYRRQGELRRRAEELSALGHEVTARWIHGFHRAAGGLDDPLWPKIAQEDVDDVAAADAVVCFLESNGGGGGGRHAEFGMALALGKRTIVVGQPENLFHTLPSVKAYATWPEALEALR